MNARPEWLSDDDAEWGPSYVDLIKSLPGVTIIQHREFGSYQGDEAALVGHDTLGVGLSIWGYGSCSGCDTLQAIMVSVGYWYPEEGEDNRDWTPLENLRTEMQNAIHWEPNLDALREWIDTNPENHWWSFDSEIRTWLNTTFGSHLKPNEWEG